MGWRAFFLTRVFLKLSSLFLELPDEHKFKALKSVTRRSWTSHHSSILGFWCSTFGKVLVRLPLHCSNPMSGESLARPWKASFPTEHFTILEPQNPPFGYLFSKKKRWLIDFEALIFEKFSRVNTKYTAGNATSSRKRKKNPLSSTFTGHQKSKSQRTNCLYLKDCAAFFREIMAQTMTRIWPSFSSS